jgi:hypothetical protein
MRCAPPGRLDVRGHDAQRPRAKIVRAGVVLLASGLILCAALACAKTVPGQTHMRTLSGSAIPAAGWSLRDPVALSRRADIDRRGANRPGAHRARRQRVVAAAADRLRNLPNKRLPQEVTHAVLWWGRQRRSLAIAVRSWRHRLSGTIRSPLRLSPARKHRRWLNWRQCRLR